MEKEYNPFVDPAELTERIERQYDALAVSEEYRGKTLENFQIRNDDDRKAKGAIESFFNSNDGHFQRGEGLTIVGPKGSGKTHLLCAIRQIITGRGHRAPLVNCVDICKRLVRANRQSKIKRDAEDEFAIIDKLANLPILLIDDFPRGIKNSDRIGFSDLDFPMLFYDLFNQRYVHCHSTFLTSNFVYKDLRVKFGADDYGDFIVDRIEGRNGNFIWLSAESYRRQVG